MLANSPNRYGLVHIALHWLMAIAIFGMFWLGDWMVDLDYYDTWYKRGPDLHRSIGVILVAVLVARLILRLVMGVPAPVESHARWERLLATIVHWGFYALILCVGVTGYLISTADGRGVLVFDWFEIPASVTSIKNQEDIAGEIHELLALTLVGLACLHAAAALSHHFVDRDETLIRMLGIKPRRENHE